MVLVKGSDLPLHVVYERFNYPVTIFTIEDPETTFGIMGLYPLVRYFKKF